LRSVLQGIERALACGFESVKLNCVVQRSTNLHQVLPLVRRFRHSGCVLRFIEYMDVGTINGWDPSEVVSAAELRALIAAEFPLRDLPLPRLGNSEVAQRWSLLDGSLELGFITSVSAPFCGDCSRARLSADGKLYTCLFSAQGHDLLSILRAQGVEVVSSAVQRIWAARDDRYSELRGGTSLESPKAEMFHLGG
jgi:cyclic pyranopterin phosphate synthase